MALRYAVHAYSWTDSWSNESLWIIDHVKELGFDLIEIPLMELEKVDPDACRERLQKAELGVCCSVVLSDKTDITGPDGGVRRRGVDFLKGCVDATHGMGAEVLSGVIYSPLGFFPDEPPTEEHWTRSAEALREVARYAAGLGITIGLEPVNRYETFLVNTCEQALRLRDMIKEDNVAIHLDAYHMNIEEDDFYNPTVRAGPHLCHYHLSESHRGIPGKGVVDWDGIYRGLADAGYSGVVGLESFVQVAEAMRGATRIWRKLAPDSDTLVTDGLKYLKAVEEKHCG
jgi:D-psicose/D-tagatose/L-ribulose 3-epimerase